MTTDLRVREAREGDLPAIGTLLADDEFSAGREGGADEVVARAFARIATDPNTTIQVLVDGEVVIGCAQLTILYGLARRGLTRGLVEAVRVSSGHRGRGYGRLLMADLVAKARAAGCGVVQLTSDKRRLDAHRFYRTIGFEQSHEGFKMRLDP